MKLNNQTRFPHPVLSSDSEDYLAGKFLIALDIEETTDTGKLKINYSVTLEEPALSKEVEAKRAIVGMFVTCLDTFYNKITIFEATSGQLEFLPGVLRGRTTVKPIVFAAQDITGYSSPNLHAEYGNMSWDFNKGALLAVGEELIINVGNEKLAPMESIFTLAINEEIKTDEIRVETDSENITIHCCAETHQLINNLRGTKIGQSILLNSIYLPVIMEVLSHLRDDESSFSHRKWFKVFSAKCDHLGINYSNGNFLEDAQKLLKSPLSKLQLIGDEL